MSNVNTATISGNATRDPDVAWVSDDGDKAIVKFAVAVNRQRTGQDGERIEEVSYVDVEVFGKFANLCAKKIQKGDAMTVSGRLQQNNWEKDGEKRSKLVLVANEIDSDAFFRSADDNRAVVVGEGSYAPAAAAEFVPAATATPAADAQGTLPATDDIPF